MKKLVITLVCLVLVIVVGGAAVVWFTYDSVDESSVPTVQVEAAGQTLQPNAWEWSQPVLGGMLYKHFANDSTEAAQLGEYETGGFAVTFPQGYDTTITLRRDDAVVFDGRPAEWQDALTAEPGAYSLQVLSHRAEEKGRPYGEFMFEALFTVLPPPKPEPVFTAGKTELEQGDIFVMRLENIPEGVRPVTTTELGMGSFTPAGEGAWFAAVPVGNHRQPGAYTVDVTAGEDSWQATVTVSAYAYPEQNLVIDTSSEQITEANSAAAYQQYREKIPPLWETADGERYWEGAFIRPAEGGWISTEFGTIRYTNGDYSNSRSHYGMDIAVAEGTPVVAPNNGRVVLAEYLLNTGNTIVIEHGGGLKSYYYHLSALDVELGDMVEKGQLIGAVGSTGYSTGAHLHYEMRIGDQAVSPSMLFEDSAGLYSVEALAGDEAGDEAA
ncbi:MAG: M23 family metallopeptidase [Ruminococcaceae bacterium]|nr:M23 family metallopeptidase [Oscillospiraceae bacterium]